MRVIPTRVHAVIDYLFGVLLIAAPYLFGFATGGAGQWVPTILGIVVIGMSLLTDYELSVAKIIPIRTHLGIDIFSGALLVISPWLFGFAEVVYWPHVILGVFAIIVPLFTWTEPESRVVRG